MSTTPPTSPGPLPPPSRHRGGALWGMGIHAACIAIACIVTPLLMGSNIWPIAGVMWSVFTVPPALLTGAAVGWTVRKLPPAVSVTVMVVTGVALAVLVGIIINRNR